MVNVAKFHYQNNYLNWVDPDINNHCAGFDPAPSHHVGLPDSCNNDICLSGDLLGILCPRMDNADGCIFPLEKEV